MPPRPPLSKASLVGIGTLGRPHGFPREGVCHFKLHFFFVGHETLPKQKSVWISDGDSHREISLAGPSSPLGGKWPQATGAKIALFGKDLKSLTPPLAGRTISLERESFAKLGANEVYLCDLLGVELHDEHEKSFGKIEACFPVGQGEWNLVARRDAKAPPFQFPLKWVDWSASQFEPSRTARFLVVPNVSVWASIDTLEGERDDDP